MLVGLLLFGIDLLLCFIIERRTPKWKLKRKRLFFVLGGTLSLFIVFLFWHEKWNATSFFRTSLILWNYLLVMSIYDMKFRELPDEVNLLFFIVSIGAFFFRSGSWLNYVITGVVVGIVFGLAALLKKNSIGGGDIKLLILCGCYMGSQQFIGFLLRGMGGAFFVSLFLLLFHKGELKTELPFVPFLLFGAVSSLLINNFT